jgi:hypothetical protein
VLIAIAAAGAYGFFVCSYRLVKFKENIRSARAALAALEKARIEFIRDGQGQRVPALTETLDRQIATAQLNLKAALLTYNAAIETFPMNIVARHKQFEKEY